MGNPEQRIKENDVYVIARSRLVKSGCLLNYILIKHPHFILY
jgi:hypothetical protein